MWMFAGYEARMGYAVKSRCREGDPKTGFNAAWFVFETDARQYADLMNVINPQHNHPDDEPCAESFAVNR